MEGMTAHHHQPGICKFPPIKTYRLINGDIRILYVNEQENTCENIFKNDLLGVIGRFIKNNFAYGLPFGIYNIDGTKIKRLTDRLMTDSLEWRLKESPRLIACKSDPDLSYARHSFERVRNVEPEQCPRFSKLLTTMSGNVTVMLQVLGAALAGKAINRNAILLYGDPGTGKNTFVEILKLLFKEKAFKKIQSNFQQDQYAAHSLQESSLWFWDEVPCDYLNSDPFKAVTGSSTYMLRPMRNISYEIEVNGNFIFTMNKERLTPSGEPAIWKDRIVGVEKHKDPEHDNQLSPEDEALTYLDELPYIYGLLLDHYEGMKDGKLDPVDTSVFDDFIAETQDVLEAVFSKYFKVIPDWQNNKSEHDITVATFGRVWLQIQSDHVQFGRYETNKKKLRQYIKERANHTKLTFRNNSAHYLPGVKLNPSPHTSL